MKNAIEFIERLKQKGRKTPPMKRALVVSLLLIVLPAVDDLMARELGGIGTSRGFRDSGNSGGRYFGSGFRGNFASALGFRGFSRQGIRPSFAFHSPRFRYPSYGLGFYAPFYTYGGYFSSGDHGISALSSSEDYDSNDSLLYSSETYKAQPNPKTNCRDTWANERHDSSLASAVRLAFQRQCENAHPTPGPTTVESTQH